MPPKRRGGNTIDLIDARICPLKVPSIHIGEAMLLSILTQQYSCVVLHTQYWPTSRTQCGSTILVPSIGPSEPARYVLEGQSSMSWVIRNCQSPRWFSW